MRKQLLILFVLGLVEMVIKNLWAFDGTYQGFNLLPQLCLIALAFQSRHLDGWLTVLLYAILVGLLHDYLFNSSFYFVLYPIIGLILYGYGLWAKDIWLFAFGIWVSLLLVDLAGFYMGNSNSLSFGLWFFHLGLWDGLFHAFILAVSVLWDHPLPHRLTRHA